MTLITNAMSFTRRFPEKSMKNGTVNSRRNRKRFALFFFLRSQTAPRKGNNNMKRVTKCAIKATLKGNDSPLTRKRHGPSRILLLYAATARRLVRRNK
ncbi:hypothetical protein EVAR_55920_1 [Eumeta japonica]|uniref:Uncharacterized protein n=1 Tax=Eumeta variegata TaxID=151549 RepID=A0A4C1YYS9_EUMVA|nr:hypothetical protein EVAR_55920_1 [Eumeta japonica]